MTSSTCLGFAPSITNNKIKTTSYMQQPRNDGVNDNMMESPFQCLEKAIPSQVKNVVASTFMAAALWCSPTVLLSNTDVAQQYSTTNTLWNDVRTSIVADAKEMASGSGSRVNKDPESLLRYGLPIPKDKEVRFYLRLVPFTI